MNIILAIVVYVVIAFGMVVIVGRGNRDAGFLDRLMEHFSKLD